MSRTLLNISRISKSFHQGEHTIDLLRTASLQISQGEIIAIVGPSGTGKTTLLNLMGALEKPDEGVIEFLGRDIVQMSEKERTAVRLKHYSFIYQNYNLVPNLTAYENMILQAVFNRKISLEEWTSLVQRLKLTDRLEHYPSELSGGEQQRVAIARAVLSKPDVMFADEPTGSIDQQLSAEIMSLLVEETRRLNSALVYVTHNLSMIAYADRCLTVRNGQLWPYVR